jgi:hypothetical protein
MGVGRLGRTPALKFPRNVVIAAFPDIMAAGLRFFGSDMSMKLLVAVAGIFLISGTAWGEDRLDDAIRLERGVTEEGAKSQKVVSRLSQETRDLLEQYRLARQKTDSLRVYNKALRELIDAQKVEATSIESQIDRAAAMEREIIPLMSEMVDVLERFKALDVPFLFDERTRRIEGLKNLLARSDVSTSEKFRQILEAYQIENEYGRTIEAYRSDIVFQDRTQTVDLLRVGRIALLYRTLDGLNVGYWSSTTKTWEELSDDYDDALRKGLSIARKQAVPDLLKVPVSAAPSLK